MKIQEGEILYEASVSRRTVTKWIVLKIYIVDEPTPKTVVVVWSREFGCIDKSPETVCCWHRSRSEAVKCLEEMRE